MIKPPRIYEALLGWILLILGGVFTLLGLAGSILAIPVRNGGAQDFALFGLPLLVFGAGLLLWARQKERSWDRLKSGGLAVQGQLIPEATRRHWYVSFGSDGFRKRSPWSVMCIYRWEGRTYFLRSEFLWRPPRETGRQPIVYLDPLNPKPAWLDPDSLQYEMKI